MYRKEKRIPTILALILVLSGIGAALYLDGTYRTITSKAKGFPNPADIHMTNISDNSITVSYVTAEETIGAINVSGENKKVTLIDDSDITGGTKPRNTHMYTIKDLTADNVYTISILNGNNNCGRQKCPEFIQRTGIKLDKVMNLPPVSGQIVEEGNKPVEGAIIYLLIGKAAPLSGRSDKLGMFVIPLNNLRAQDLLSRPVIDGNATIQLTIKNTPAKYASVLTNLDQILKNPKLSAIEIGKNYNYVKSGNLQREVLGNNSVLLSPTKSPEISKSGIDILFPEHKLDTTIDKQPKLRGIGIPGDKIKITIQSTVQTATVTVSKDGTWEYRPKQALLPGSHTITIQGKDNSGKKVTISEQFVVLKSGEAVLGDATPSGTLTPTNTPSPTLDPNISLTPTGISTISGTLTPTKTPTPTNTPSPTPTFTPSPTPSSTPVPEPTATSDLPPRSGNSDWTKLLLGGGITLVLIGLKFLL